MPSCLRARGATWTAEVVIFMPKNSVHTLKNVNDTPSRMLFGMMSTA